MPNPSSAPKLAKIARYEILREIGRGGMATVYLAQDPNFEREVAIKVLPHEALHDSTLYQRFQREARTIASLEHPAIVPVHDFGEEDGQPFLVMRYLSGGSLSARIKAGPLPIAEAAKILLRIGGALDAAHAKGIVHRDLKPANILFDQYGEAYLSDFGIAQLSEATSPLTGSAILGTPAYMSPEQIRGDGKVDGRADIYALGIVLFEMLTGKTPFKADTPAQMMMMHLANPTPRLPEEKSDLPDTINGVLIRAMAKDPELRFQKASQLGSVISAIASGEAPDLSETSATYGYFKETSATRIDSEDGGPRRPSRAAKKSAEEEPAGKTTKKWPAIAIAAIVVLCLCGIGGAAGGYALYKNPDALSSLLSPKGTATAIDTDSPTEGLLPAWEVLPSEKAIPTVDQTPATDQETSVPSFESKIIETNGTIKDIAWSPDGTMLAIAGNGDGGIRFLDTSTWEVLFILQGHNGAAKTIKWAGDSKSLFSLGDNDEIVILWDVSNQEKRLHEDFLGVQYPMINDIDMSQDGKYFAATNATYIYLWNTTKITSFDAYSQGMLVFLDKIAFSPDSARIAYSTSAMKDIGIWDIATKKVINFFSNNNIFDITSIGWTPDGQKLAVGGTQNLGEGKMIQQIWVWDMNSNQVMIPKNLSKYEGMMDDFVVCSDGKQFASGGSDFIVLWDPKTSEPWYAFSLKDFNIGYDPIESLASSPGGDILAIGLHSGKIILWNIPPIE